MRETLDRRDPRPAAPRRPLPADGTALRWVARAGGGVAGIGRVCLRRPGEALSLLAGIAAVAAVSVNALGWQGARHPAPIPLGAGARPAVQAAKAAEKAAPAEAAKPHRAQEAKTGATVEPNPAPRIAARDPIGDVIRAGETTASVTPKAAAAKPEASVLQAQRALAKLGYGPVKADGLMGAGTRAAIEKFERDRKLPVKGEAAGRTLRELAARAALPQG